MSTTARQRVGWGAANVIVVLIAAIPVLWLVSLSFKDPSTITDGSFYPHKWTTANYRGIFDQPLFTHALVNSIGIALISTFLGVVLGAMAAYAIARLDFPGKRLLVASALLIAMFPAISLVNPMFNLWRTLGHLRHLARADHPVHDVLASALDLHALGVLPRDPVGARAGGGAGRGHADAGVPPGDHPACRPRRLHHRDPRLPLLLERLRVRDLAHVHQQRPHGSGGPRVLHRAPPSSSSRPGRSPPRRSSSPFPSSSSSSCSSAGSWPA